MAAPEDQKEPATRRMLEKILAVEEEHAEEMLGLLDGLNIVYDRALTSNIMCTDGEQCSLSLFGA